VRIQDVGDILHNIVANGGEVNAQILFEVFFVLSKRIHEFKAFLDVVSCHDLDGRVEFAFTEKSGWESGHEVSI
jgi:hypothetical protein